VEVGNRQDLVDRRAAVDDRDVGAITSGTLAQQQQHAERRAVHVLGLREIDDVARLLVLGVLERLAELLVQVEIEAPADRDGHDPVVNRPLCLSPGTPQGAIG
jgi:hypothetical protein